MRILGIETSGTVGGYAVVEDGRVLAEASAEITGRHLEQGSAMMRRVLESSATPLAGLGAVAVSLGPGSFTGLRVGLAQAKGLCFGRGIPLVGVPTLDAVAEGTVAAVAGLAPGAGGILVAARDARRGEIYFAAYDTPGGAPRRLTQYGALPPGALADRLLGLKEAAGKPLVVLGDALARYGATLSERLGGRMVAAPENLWHPRPAIVAVLGERLLAAGQSVDIDGLEPIYVRVSEAERSAAGGADRGEGRNPKDA